MKKTFSKLPMFAYRIAVLTAACFFLSWLAASAGGLNKVHAYPESIFRTYGALKFATGKVVASRKVSAKGVEELVIETTSTDVTFERGGANEQVEIELQGHYPTLQEPLSIETKEGSIAVRTREAGTEGKGFRFNINFEGSEGGLRLKVPAGVKRVLVKTVSGDMAFDDLDLITLAVKTTSGDLKLRRVKLVSLAFKSTSGDMEAEQLEVAKVQAESVSGDLELGLENADPKIEATTVSGDIDLSFRDRPSVKAVLTTVSGELQTERDDEPRTVQGPTTSISLGEAKGAIFAKTTSGDLRIREH